MPHIRAIVAGLLLAICCSPTTASARQSVHLAASLTPERLAGETSIGLSVGIAGAAGRVPSPVTRIDLRYPGNLGIALSGLGIETCSASTLEVLGPAGCPADSIMGRGSALGEIPFGPEIIRESAPVTIVRAEDQSGHLALLFDAQGISPVAANVVLPRVLLPARQPYGGDIRIEVPLIPSLPEAPDVAVVELSATIGPAAGLTYVERQAGKTLSYTPKGFCFPTAAHSVGSRSRRSSRSTTGPTRLRARG